jgi:C-terminal processing protease CtpA/Prc
LRFSDFAGRVLADVDAHPVKRVVIDMRENGGGDSRIIRPLKDGLEARLGKIGHVYVLIGPVTFSAGTDNAIELQSSLHATLVGEATGGKPSSYGEVKYVTLPNSKLIVQYTTKWFGSRKDSEPAALEPDVPVPLKLADALSGRDPALEAALSAR